ncbi:MAG: ABC transporter ATP-binding protein [Deltaproteobacteria bacterium]|nr:MAG: ABC transporter ATP-binding protein [Deltaproteobacteria bacterium]
MDETILEIDGLWCGYRNRAVLQEVGFAVSKGDFVGVIGPNGSGKTTLIRAISGLLPLQKGVVLLEGKAIGEMGRKELATKVAVVTQSPETTPPFSVEEFVLLGRVPHWGRLQFLETRRDEEIAKRVMALTEIAHLRGRGMGELSGGERQLAYLARALAQEPELLLLDEPTAHLDIGHQVQIMDLLRRLNRENSLTIMTVLHDLNLAGLYCERLILLHEGRLHRIGPPKGVLTEGVIEEVYRTAVMVMEVPVKDRPIIFPVPGEE